MCCSGEWRPPVLASRLSVSTVLSVRGVPNDDAMSTKKVQYEVRGATEGRGRCAGHDVSDPTLSRRRCTRVREQERVLSDTLITALQSNAVSPGLRLACPTETLMRPFAEALASTRVVTTLCLTGTSWMY